MCRSASEYSYSGMLQANQESLATATLDLYRKRFLEGVAEYNSYGIAAVNPKYRLDPGTASLYLGFKAGTEPSWKLQNQID